MPAHVSGPYAVDDASIGEVGECQVESWLSAASKGHFIVSLDNLWGKASADLCKSALDAPGAAERQPALQRKDGHFCCQNISNMPRNLRLTIALFLWQLGQHFRGYDQMRSQALKYLSGLRWRLQPANELSFFLIAYLLGLLGILLLVHVLQPEREGGGSSSRSPVHQERQMAN